ncbi:MAG: PEP-CTERM sorting domain-containing protein [Verrucomicrobia bacterium]|nr:PEP-CTERM sorting domain-containing protein [Verrucomicrobiota bacterium]
MTRTKAHLSICIGLLSAALLGNTAGFAAVVYNNTQNNLNRSFAPAAVNGATPQFGDQVFLTGSDRRITDFQFEYFLTGPGGATSGNETGELFFHRNDAGTTGIEPGTQLYRSGEFSLSTGFQTVVAQALSVTVPSTFTWSVIFRGIEANEQAGLLIYNPPTVGSSFDDFWQRNANGTWSTLLDTTASPVPMNFAARITAVPEPGTYALAAIGGLFLIAARRFKRRSA